MNKTLIKAFFTLFILLTPIGFMVIFSEQALESGFWLVLIGIVSGLVCAVSPCSSCGKPTGVISKGLFGAVFPLGYCFHCGKSYLK